MKIVLRTEEKYLIKKSEAVAFEKIFGEVLERDKFSACGSYIVRSLYFDTLNDDDFFNKINEQEKRRKIRLRIYDPNTQSVKLELKQKQGQVQKKRSLTISKEDAIDLINGRYNILLKYKHPFADELYVIMSMECYRPKTIVEYNRMAFMAKENNIRLTFDSHIRATESSFDLFDSNLLLNMVLPMDNVVFEVKYDRFMLGYISDIIRAIDRRTISVSKYCLGRQIGYPLWE